MTTISATTPITTTYIGRRRRWASKLFAFHIRRKNQLPSVGSWEASPLLRTHSDPTSHYCFHERRWGEILDRNNLMALSNSCRRWVRWVNRPRQRFQRARAVAAHLPWAGEAVQPATALGSCESFHHEIKKLPCGRTLIITNCPRERWVASVAPTV